MRHSMSLKARRELLAVTAPRYQTSDKKQRQKILDEFVASTGYHRKYAIPLLKHYQTTRQGSDSLPTKQNRSKRGRRPIYTKAVKEALIIAWEAACRICSKRLVPFLPVLVPVLEKHGYLNLCPEVRQKLLTLEFCDKTGKKAHCTLTNEQRQHNRPARSAHLLPDLPGDKQAC
jgi:hypothetical protein